MPHTIILVNPSFQFEKHLVKRLHKRRQNPRHIPPLGLLQIGGLLRQNGYKVIILDANIEKNPYAFLDKVLNEEKVLMVGISVKLGPPLLFAMQLSHYIKKNYPRTNVVWGGKLPSILPREVLEQTFADYIVVDQGEESALLLADALAAGKKKFEIPGVGHLPDTTYHLTPQNAFHHHYTADWSLLEGKINFEQRPYLAALLLSKGCPFKCSFCYNRSEENALHSPNRWVQRDLQTVMTDIDGLFSQGVRVLSFLDDCTLLNANLIKSLSAEIKKREMYVEQFVTHVSTIRPEIIKHIAGFTQQVAYSIETVSPNLQRILNKSIAVDEIIAADTLLADNNINTIHNFIVGIPDETDEDLRLNIELAVTLRNINPFVRFSAIFCFPYPKSDLEAWIRENKKFSIPNELRLLSTADLHNIRINPVFQPWLSDPAEKDFYEKFMFVFEAVFSRWQTENDETVKALLANKRLARIFEPISRLSSPVNDFPYILDRLVNHGVPPYPQAKMNFLSEYKIEHK